MATKAEQFKDETQRAAQQKHPPHPGHESAGKRAKQRGRVKQGLPNPTTHNESIRAAKNSSYQLEPSPGADRPSRKSTRRSATHQKTDTALRMRAVNRNASPKARAQRKSGKPR